MEEEYNEDLNDEEISLIKTDIPIYEFDLPDLMLCGEAIKTAFNILTDFDKELSEHLTYSQWL